jgi:hypothetical protein
LMQLVLAHFMHRLLHPLAERVLHTRA